MDYASAHAAKAAVDKYLGLVSTWSEDRGKDWMVQLHYYSPSGVKLYVVELYENGEGLWQVGGLEFSLALSDLAKAAC